VTRAEFRALLGPLVLVSRADFDEPTWTAYYRTLEDVPAALLGAAVDRALKSPSAWMPKPGELRAAAEDARLALRAAHPHEGCIECEDSRGWRTVTYPDGAKVERCPCWRRHQERLAALGISGQPLALPAPADNGFA
jgi:hypothetical protein